MLDMKYIIISKDEGMSALKKRNIHEHTIAEIITIDEKRRALIQKLEEIKAEKNKGDPTLRQHNQFRKRLL